MKTVGFNGFGGLELLAEPLAHRMAAGWLAGWWWLVLAGRLAGHRDPRS